MPWPEREARMWQIAFPQMTNWLPPDEGDQLKFEFAQEMQRLARAACFNRTDLARNPCDLWPRKAASGWA